MSTSNSPHYHKPAALANPLSPRYTRMFPSAPQASNGRDRRLTVERLVDVTRAALLWREWRILQCAYFARDLQSSRDLGVELAFSNLADEDLTPPLQFHGTLTESQVRAIARLYRALMAEQRRSHARPDRATSRDLRLPTGDTGDGGAYHRLNARMASVPPQMPRGGCAALAHGSPTGVRRVRSNASTPVASHRFEGDFSASGSWQHLPPLGWRPPTWTDRLKHATAAMIATTLPVRAAFPLVT